LGSDLNFADRGTFQVTIDGHQVLSACLLDLRERFSLGVSRWPADCIHRFR
jgi:hypothetical protein